MLSPTKAGKTLYLLTIGRNLNDTIMIKKLIPHKAIVTIVEVLQSDMSGFFKKRGSPLDNQVGTLCRQNNGYYLSWETSFFSYHDKHFDLGKTIKNLHFLTGTLHLEVKEIDIRSHQSNASSGVTFTASCRKFYTKVFRSVTILLSTDYTAEGKI